MKQSFKIGSLLLAAVMAASSALAGCSFSKEWSYRANGNELPIGVYIYSLDLAYNKAQSYASEQVEGYATNSDAWLNEKIKDDDGNEMVASEWIKDQAETMCLSYLVVDEQLEKEGATVDEATMSAADEQAETYWNVGQYASYGLVQPMSKELEPYGISLESFKYATTEYSAKYSKLFETVYGEGGSKEVSDKEVSKYYTENYVDFSYVPVNLYTSSTDDDGNSTNKALSEDEAKKLKKEIDGYAKSINSGDDFTKTVESYMKANKIEQDPTQNSVEVLESDSFSLGDDIKAKVKDLGNGKAATVQVGDGDSAIYYLVYKNDINDSVDNMLKSAESAKVTRSTVVNAMKTDEFADYIKGLAKELEHEKNPAVDSYNPNMFFVSVEPTTAAETTAAEEDTTAAE